MEGASGFSDCTQGRRPWFDSTAALIKKRKKAFLFAYEITNVRNALKMRFFLFS
jgi:hypothetical protein